MLTLIALNGQEKGRVFQLAGEAPELLGRQAPTIKLTDAQTSRRHAEVLLQNNTWLIRDLGSTNGTWVNGQRISHITELEAGDRLVVGRHQFRVSEISELPAPTPQPKAPHAEPAIGHEELAAMGVDLSESLSADLLEDDEDLPTLPEESLTDNHEGIGAPLADIDKADADAAAPPVDAAEDDALIDLDALLSEDSPAESLGQPETTPGPLATESKDGAADDLVVAPASTDDDGPTPAVDATGSDDGVLDLDAMLDEAPVSTPAEIDEPANDQPPVEETADELQPEIQDKPDIPVPLDTPSTDDDFDVDEYLGLKDEQDNPVSPEATSAEPVSGGPEELTLPSESEPPTTDTGDTGDDSAIDLDALLDDVTDQSDGAEPVSGIADVLDDAEALNQDLADQPGSPDDQVDTESTDEPVEPESQSEEQSGSLVDVDILGAAAPTASLGARVDEDIAHDDVASEVLDDLAADLDEHPKSDPTEVEEPASESDQVKEVGESDGGEDQGDDLTPALPDDDVAESDKELLLSPNEQAQVVSSYRRSKLMTLLILVISLGVLGTAGWFGYNFLTNRANATSQPVGQDVKPAPDSDVADVVPTDATEDTLTGTNDQPKPDVAEPAAPEANQPPEPEPYDLLSIPGTPIKDDAKATPVTPDASPKTAEDSIPPLADPFEDISGLNIDQPIGNEPLTPANDTPDTDAPEAETGKDDTTTPAATQDGTALPVSNENQPKSTTEADTALNPTADSLSPSEEHTGVQPGELEALSGAIDAQHTNGSRAAEQAAFAGARKVVYVVDASGSLVDSFPRVLNELNRAVLGLPDEQAFTVIFFGAEGVTEVPPVGLRWADGQNKRQLVDWISPDKGNVTAWGRGDAIEAMQRAIGYHPDEVVILSDNLIGRQVSQEAVAELLDTIAEMVGEDVEMIHVIQFFDRDPQQVLKRIAERFNGTYNLIENLPSSSAQTAVDDTLVEP